ncbi:MAG: hypothetical protein AAF092_00395 [Pseudomonadota bacterium]
MHKSLQALCVGVAVACSTGSVSAQDAAPSLSLELNATQTLDSGCRLTFVIENNMAADLDTAVFETVLFTTDGLVDRLTLFDMQTLPVDRPRVRQFDVSNLACETLGRVLVNGVQACSGAGIDAAACQGALTPSSRVDGIEMLG